MFDGFEKKIILYFDINFNIIIKRQLKEFLDNKFLSFFNLKIPC